MTVKRVLVTGGAGYVGAVLVPKLLAAGYEVRVLDLYLYGLTVLDPLRKDPWLTQTVGDIRDTLLLKKTLAGCDAVIHLACISNDPSFELDPLVGKSINFDAFLTLANLAMTSGVKRFIYASSSSVYGHQTEDNVTEDLPLRPLTDYSKYKALCEEFLLEYREAGFVPVIVRPATICGYSPRLRLDLVVNALTNDAVNKGVITVFGGDQYRANIHIEDMTDLYVQLLSAPSQSIDAQVFNVGAENYTVNELAEIVRAEVGGGVQIKTEPSNDQRSYRISSLKIKKALGFVPRRTVSDAVCDLLKAFRSGLVPDALTNSRYYNVKMMRVERPHWRMEGGTT